MSYACMYIHTDTISIVCMYVCMYVHDGRECSLTLYNREIDPSYWKGPAQNCLFSLVLQHCKATMMSGRGEGGGEEVVVVEEEEDSSSGSGSGSGSGCLLLSLPLDPLLTLLSFLDPKDLLQLASSCTFLRRVAHSDCLWMSLCGLYKNWIDLPSWRSGVDSAAALFRLLSSFSPFVGLWTAKGQEPRGSLLYVTWGSLSLVAYDVFSSNTDVLQRRRVFEAVGQRNGSFNVEIFSNDACLTGKLLWTSQSASEFTLEAHKLYDGSTPRVPQGEELEPSDGSFLMHLLRRHQSERTHYTLRQSQATGMIYPDFRMLGGQVGNGNQVTMPRRLYLLQRFLEHRFVLEEDHHQPQESGGLSFSQRALQYLIRLSSTARNDLALEVGHNEGSSIEHGHILQCSYNKLAVCIGSSSLEANIIGLWSGSYGPHGIEIINVTHTDEGIVGTKVLGDPNVPCGQPTFRVNISMEAFEVPVELQQIVDLQLSTGPEHFNIAKVYTGEGRIAGHNFRDPSWVPGHLLVSERGEIAFLWEDINFVVLFHKVDLALFCESQNQLPRL